MDEPIRSRPYKATMCCERCVFNRGEHSEDCQTAQRKETAIRQLEVLSKVANKAELMPTTGRLYHHKYARSQGSRQHTDAVHE